MKKSLAALSCLFLFLLASMALAEPVLGEQEMAPDALLSSDPGVGNTWTGTDALAKNTTGSFNTADGYAALYSNIKGYANTAGGYEALFQNLGSDNTASGYAALFSNISGYDNTAVGVDALFALVNGYGNTAHGALALYTNTGNLNTALGYKAGWPVPSGPPPITTGSRNIYIGHDVYPATTGESYTIRIGSDQTKTCIAGISGRNIGSGAIVYVKSNGQLGILASSRLYKEDIEDMGHASDGLMKLRPVTFHYKPEYAEGPRKLQYGLIAEEVAKVYPDLVEYDQMTGQPQTVYYQHLNAMLLNEVQKQQKEISDLKERVGQQSKELSALKEQNKKLSALEEQMRELSAMVERTTGSSTQLSKLEAQLSK
jgi:hypothetical protein